MKMQKEGQYFSFNELDPTYNTIIEFIADNKETINSIADVGCGGGYLAQRLRCLFPELSITVIDSDPSLLRSISDPNIEKLQGSIPGICSQRKFDFVIAKDVIEHIPDVVEAISELTMMSSRYLFISAPGPFTEAAWGDLTHVRPYNRTTLGHISRRYNFRILLMGSSRRNIFVRLLARLIKLNIDEISVYAFYEKKTKTEWCI